MSPRTPRYIYLILIIAPFIIFAPIILSGRALFWGTPITQFIPWWTWAWEALSGGVLPLWNPMLGMGAPLIANYQSALFYPPTWIYFLLYSIGDKALMAWGQAGMVVLHLSWAALGIALVIRQLRMGKLAQIVAGLAFGLSGYLVARAGFLSINAAVAWMPWVILGVTRLIEEYHLEHESYTPAQKSKHRSRRITIISAYLLLLLSIAMQLLAGHAQITWYTLILAVFWTLYLLVFTFNFDKRSEHDGNTSLESKRIEVEIEDYLPDDKGD